MFVTTTPLVVAQKGAPMSTTAYGAVTEGSGLRQLV
jgi:hypothetical protein